jgi:hypothetical protein
LIHGRNSIAGDEAAQALFTGPSSIGVPRQRAYVTIFPAVKELKVTLADLRRNWVAG